MPRLSAVSAPLFPVALALSLAPHTAAQTPIPEVRLGAAERILPHQFTQIRGVRELPDGRLLVSDRLEPALYALDWNGNRLTRIGREGDGPAEYRLPGALVPLPGDSTLVIDEGNLRLLVVGPDLVIRRGFSNQRPGLIYGIYPRAVDARGRFYFQIPGWASGARGDPPPDSIVVARIDWKTGSMDTLTRVKNAADPGPIKRGLPYIPFSPQDVWLATPEGRVIVVRVGDYHIDFRAVDGRITRGASVPYSVLPVTQEDRISHTRNFLENTTVGGRGGANSNPTGNSALPADWLTKEAVERMAAENEFAERKPPFTELTPRAAPDGSLWVERSVVHGAARTFDVFDAAGALARRVQLPTGRRLISIGAAGVYLAFSGDDGFETLERYRTP